MIYLGLSIICNVLLLVIIKSFERFKIPNLQGIVINYFVAGITALFFIPNGIELDGMVHAKWFPTSLLLGALFISIFFLISLTAQRISISVASVANKMSVVIPVILAFILYGDKVYILKIAGIILALASVYLTTYKSSSSEEAKPSLVLPSLVFIGSGIIDALVNFANKKLITELGDDAGFSCMGFFSAGMIGLCILSYQFTIKKIKFEPRSLIAGLVLGIPNFFSIYFILKALSTGILESSQLYPIANIFIVVFSAIAGILLFKEKLNKINIIGILLSILATLMITFSGI